MEDSDNNEYFWPSYVDFVMVLFFIALALGGYMYMEYQEKVKEQQEIVNEYKAKLKGLEQYQKLVSQVIKINESLKAELIKNHIQIDSSNTEKIKLKSDFYFDHNSSVIKQDVIGNIIAIGNSIKLVLNTDSNFSKCSIIVEGHTDADGTEEYNSNLSCQRALSITNMWSAECDFKLPKYEILPSGFGELKPIADNNSDSSKALNRRIEIAIIPKLSEFTKMMESSSSIRN